MLFHPSIYDHATAAPSWWAASAPKQGSEFPRLEGDRHCEIAVIGGGYTGLSAALHLAHEFQRDVCLVEAGQPGWGASGRNGGFCCMGAAMLSHEAMIRRYGLQETRLFHSIQTEAVDLVVPKVAPGLMPAISAILVTRPLTAEEIADQGWTRKDLAYDTRALLHYFRLLPDARFLFGGRGGTSGSPGALERRKRVLARSFRSLFPAWKSVGVSHFWSGLVCLSHDRVPHISSHPDDPTIVYALAYHGNGVAMATWQGRTVAGMMSDANKESKQIPTFMRAPLKAFPLAALRLSYLRAAYLGYALRDAL